MSETSGHDLPEPQGPGSGATERVAARSGWSTVAQVALIVAALLLVQRVVLPWLGLGT